MTTRVGPLTSGSFPYQSVVYMEVTWANGTTTSGTGVVVGQNDVLTAAHVVYNAQLGGIATSVTVYPGRDGTYSPHGSFVGDRVNYYEWDSDGDNLLSQYETQYDVAVIGFDERIGDTTGWMGLAPATDSGYFNLTGYPTTYADFSGPRMTNEYGFTNEDFSYDVLNNHDFSVFPGHSGSPLWYSQNGDYYISGIVSTDASFAGLDKTYSQILDWMESNDTLLDGDADSGGGNSGGDDSNSGHDVVFGSIAADRYFGGRGNDTLYGNEGNDFLQGNQDADNLYGGADNDTLRGGQDDDYLSGGDGEDSLYGDIGGDYIVAGNGNDFINGGRISSYEGNDQDSLYGGSGSDFIQGNLGNDYISGGAGDDTLRGGLGNDFIDGGDGDDRLYGDRGNDSLVGGNGSDTAFYNGVIDDYSFINNGGVWTVTDNRGINGTDTIWGGEFIVFDDGIYTL
ncbi:trypsin-like peptidase domain-containing protein [Rhodovibrionaceae bacterium A322]